MNTSDFEPIFISLQDIQSRIMDTCMYNTPARKKDKSCYRLKELVNNDDLKAVSYIIYDWIMEKYIEKVCEGKGMK